MTHSFKLSRRIARLRAPAVGALILAFTACDTSNSLNPDSSSSPGSGVMAAPVDAATGTSLASTSLFAGGIPIGLFHGPATSIGSLYSGTLQNVGAKQLINELQTIRSRGGKAMLVLAGAPPRYTNGSGNFSLTMWKASMDRFKNVNISSFINDGTIIGNFLIDEPNDPSNWKNHQPVSAATVEEMARYSKSRWPGMATIVRTRPDNLLGSHHYLDAAWSQYHSRFGNPASFVAHDAAVAKSKGLALVVGMNVLRGNGGGKMTASQIKSWGSALLSSSYPCAFLSWTYNSTYLSTSAMKSAMSYLRSKAQNRVAKSCKG